VLILSKVQERSYSNFKNRTMIILIQPEFRSNSLEIKLSKVGIHSIANLSGRLDIAHADELEAKLQYEILDGKGDIVINLKDINYISSSGIRVFVGMFRDLNRQGRRLLLCAITPGVKKVFEVVELLDMFEVFETEEQALKSILG
jgi:anti-sigma B factor antagonist